MRFSLISVGVNIALGVALFYVMGFQGVAIATSVAAWISVLQMWFALARRGVWKPSARAAFKITRVAVASVLLGAVMFAANVFRAEIEGVVGAVLAHGVKEVSIILICSVGLALYPVLLFASGGVTVAEAKGALRRRRGDPPPTADVG